MLFLHDNSNIKDVSMTRIIFSLIIAGLCFVSTTQAQMQISFGSESGDAGTQVSVDVTSENFPALILYQFSVNWDSSVMRINSITNINSNLPSYSSSSFGLPSSSVDVVAGQLTTSWDHPAFMETTLQPGEVLFTMVFDLVGNAGDQSDIVVSDEPSVREAVLGDFSTDIGIVGNVGSVTINGGGGGGGTDLTVNIPDRVTSTGNTVCLPFSVQNFNDIQSIQFTIDFDPAIATYNRVQGFGLPFLDANDFNPASVASGQLLFFWSDDDNNLNSLNDGDVLFEVCFDAVGPLGSSTPVDITDNPVDIEFFGNGVTYSVGNGLTLNNGSITILEDMVDPPSFSLGSVTGEVGDTVCVPVSVTDFIDLVSFRHSITWNSGQLQFVEVGSTSLPGLAPFSFANVNPGQLNVLWNSPSNNNSSFSDDVIYEICFEVLDPCPVGTSRAINIGQAGITPEVGTINGSGNPVEVVGVVYNNGSIDCVIEAVCPTITAIAADCQDGAGDLLVAGDLSAFDPSCECRWTGPATQTTTVGSGNCNFIGVPAGDYTFTIVCDGETRCMEMVTVDAAPMIVVDGNVTNASCGELGSITVVPDEGSTPYSFMWSNGQNTPTITGLQPAMYTVTVTDAALCSNTRIFTVSAEVDELIIASSNVADVLCNSDSTGGISVTAEGGCTPYEYAWTGSTSTISTASGLAAGPYSVTVTDDTGATVEMAFSVSEPTALSVNATTNPACPDVAEGSITLSVMGGVPQYTGAWTTGDAGLSLSDVLPESYTVTVTDANSCTIVDTYVVAERDPAMCDGSCPTASAFLFADYNGFGVSCNGASDGGLDFDLAGGMYPLNVTLTGPTSSSITVNADGSYNFEDLAPGSYTLTSTDQAGMECMLRTFTVSEPSPFEIVNVSVGNVVSGCDGFIDYELTGGVGSVTCFLNGVVETDCDFSNLCTGMYLISFVDANGCEVQRMETIVDTTTPPGPCYEANTVITPNGDGANDFFVVSCVLDFPTRLQVYDRWGALVHEQQNYDNTWNGIDLGGTALPESGYMYALTVDFGNGRSEIFKGTVTVLR